MKTKEEKIIAQFAKIHTKSDWQLFKTVAEYYFKKSATLKKTDIEISDPYKLLIRNIQKRLFLGIATELLIKSCYLKNGYYINKPNDNKKHNSLLLKIKDINKSEFNPDNTFTLGILIDNLDKVIVFTDWKIIKEGLNILRVLSLLAVAICFRVGLNWISLI